MLLLGFIALIAIPALTFYAWTQHSKVKFESQIRKLEEAGVPATAETLKDGWVHTGDAGFLDEEGYVYVSDRIKDMIIAAGENIYPAEIESVLTGHPAVSEAAVIGVPDDTWGEAVKAVVVPRPGETVDPDALVALVKKAKGSVQAPKSVDIVDSIPLSALGKPDKKALRAMYWGERERGVN